MRAMNRSAVGFGTFGGVVMGMFPHMFIGDFLKTILLASVGAVVSFFVSLVLGRIIKKKK